MKKILTLLALCCLVVTGAWADVQKLRLSFSSITATGATVSVTDQNNSTVSGVTATVSQPVKTGGENTEFFTTGAGCDDKVLGVKYGKDQNDYWEVTFTVSGLSAFIGRSNPSIDVCTPLLNASGAYQNAGTIRAWDRTLTVGDSQYGELSGNIENTNNEVLNHFENASATISGDQLVLKVKMKRTDSNGCYSGVKYIDINMPVQQEYTVNITGATGATVTYDGTAYSNNETITATGLAAADLTASAVTGYFPATVTIGTNTITVAYEKFPFEVASSVENITHWYALNINSNTSNYLSSNGSAIALSSTYESAAAYAWGFVGNATDGYAVYNKATGTYISNADPCALASEGFHWEVAKGVKGSVFNSGGFCLGEPGKTGNSKYINLQSGALKRWNADNGSTFNAVELTLEEPATPEAVEVPYTLTPTDGATITSIDDLATITLQFTGEDVEEGLMPMTAEDMEKEPVYPTLTKGSTIITATSIAMNDDTGFYDITFPTTDITDGEWKLCIPEGAFYTMDWLTLAELVVAEITATYTVASVVPADVIATLTINGVETNYNEGDDIVLKDGEAGLTKVVIPNDVDNVDVTYTREFKNTNSQPWYVPFEITVPDGFTFYKIWNLEVDESTGVATAVVSKELSSGETIKANTPYIVKANNAGTYNFNTNALKATVEGEANNKTWCATTELMYHFYGSYTSFDLSSKPCYYMSTGTFYYATSTTTLRPYRFYLVVAAKKTDTPIWPADLENAGAGSKLQIITLGDEEDMPTGIGTVIAPSKNDIHFDLMGRKVNGNVSGLQIVNGEKILVK